jgi:Sec-independent protein translocase protein TatA
MVSFSLTIVILILVGCFVSGCAEIKEAGRTIGHTTRDVTREIGHGAREVTREIGHGTREVVRDIGGGTGNSPDAVEEKPKKVMKPTNEGAEY